jgi:hypothetical protein
MLYHKISPQIFHISYIDYCFVYRVFNVEESLGHLVGKKSKHNASKKTNLKNHEIEFA